MNESTPNSLRLPGPAESLRALAVRAAAGDANAFERIHERLAGGLRRFFLTRCSGKSEISSELEQSTWTEAWRAVREGRYDPERAAISTFVYAIGYKIWLQQRRRYRTQPALLDGSDQVLSSLLQTHDDPDEVMHAVELLDAVRECMGAEGTAHSLSREERMIVDGLARQDTERSLARALEVSPSTIHAWKKSAYEKLRRCLAAKGFGPRGSERRGESGE